MELTGHPQAPASLSSSKLSPLSVGQKAGWAI